MGIFTSAFGVEDGDVDADAMVVSGGGWGGE